MMEGLTVCSHCGCFAQCFYAALKNVLSFQGGYSVMNFVPKVACLIPTFNGVEEFQRLLASLKVQTAQFDIHVVDSSSTDGTLEVAEAFNLKLLTIPKSDFNHGGTRQLLVEQCMGYDIFVFVTQDAVLEDSRTIERMICYFQDGQVGAVCGRQLPHPNANLLAQHARLFNYPDVVQIKSLEDTPVLGIKTAFMSNSFSAYRSSALKAINGFPSNVILSEDMYAAAKMLQQGWKIVYAGDVRCYHSHNYSLSEETKRYFDIGVFHAREFWIRDAFGGAGNEGLRYVKSELGFLGFKRFFLWPYALLRSAAKLMGYKLGQKEHLIPIRVKRFLSMNRSYWDHPRKKIV